MTAVETSKLVAYAVMDYPDNQVGSSKLTAYAVMDYPDDQVGSSKLTAYAVMVPPPPPVIEAEAGSFAWSGVDAGVDVPRSTAKLHDRVYMTTATVGDGPIVLGTAVDAFRSFEDVRVANGAVVSYTVEDGSAWEVGRGTYDRATQRLLRSTVLASSNGGVAISLSGAAKVFVTALAEDLTRVYDFGMVQMANPGDGDVMGKVILPRAMTLAADFAGSTGDVDTNPTASFAISVTKNGTEVGTITVSTAGAFTFATTGSAAVSIAAGDVIRFVAGNDASVAGIAVTLVGELT